MEDLGVFLKNFDTNDDNRINEAVEILGPQFSRRYCNKSSRVLGLVNFAEANGGLDSFDFATFSFKEYMKRDKRYLNSITKRIINRSTQVINSMVTARK